MTNLSGVNLNNGSTAGAKREGMDSPSYSLALMPKYEAYKDSGVEWIGDIPGEWSLRRFKFLITERNERSQSGEENLLSVSQYTGVTNKSDKLIEGDLITNAESLEGYKKVKKGDLVSNIMLAWNGSLGVSPFDGITSPAYAVYRFGNECLDRFYHYLLRTELYKSEFKRRSTGVIESRLRLYTDDFFDVVGILPSLKEQLLIANFLDKKTTQIDDAIAIKEQQISLLKERKQIIIQQAVTQGLDPNVPMKDSGVDWIGKIPAHWELTRLKFHSEIQSGITLGKAYKTNNPIEIPYIRVANVQFGYFKLDDVAVLNLPRRELERYLLQDKDILVTEGGDIDKLGRGTVWKSEITPCIHQNHVFAIRIDLTKFRHDFVANYLAADSTRKHFISTATKTTNLASTNRTHLGNLYLPILSIQEQDEINSFILLQSSFIETGVTDLEAQIEKLKEYKTTLINSAVTGKIKITPEMVEQ
jgi:type I restriction enzyme S subunit